MGDYCGPLVPAMEPAKPEPSLLALQGATPDSAASIPSSAPSMSSASAASMPSTQPLLASSSRSEGLDSSGASLPAPVAAAVHDVAQQMQQQQQQQQPQTQPQQQTGEQRSSKKTEMNRKAQQRYRRRKKEMFEEQQRLNVELALKCNELAKASAQSHARTFYLEEMMDLPHHSPEAAEQAGGRADASLQAFADTMLELLHLLAPDQEVGILRQLLLQGALDMLDSNTATISFLRNMLVQQVAECLIHLDMERSLAEAEYSRLCKLMGAYVTMVQRAGAANVQALLTFLSLSADAGGVPALASTEQHWPTITAGLQLLPGQQRQLLDAHAALSATLGRLAQARTSLGSHLAALVPVSASLPRHVAIHAQAENCLDLYRKGLVEERQSMFEFIKLTTLVLDPVQHARLMLASYPQAPDMLAVCTVLGQGPSPGPRDFKNSPLASGSAAMMSGLGRGPVIPPPACTAPPVQPGVLSYLAPPGAGGAARWPQQGPGVFPPLPGPMDQSSTAATWGLGLGSAGAPGVSTPLPHYGTRRPDFPWPRGS